MRRAAGGGRCALYEREGLLVVLLLAAATAVGLDVQADALLGTDPARDPLELMIFEDEVWEDLLELRVGSEERVDLLLGRLGVKYLVFPRSPKVSYENG